MRTHLIIISDLELQEIFEDKREYILRFFKKRPEFFSQIETGDIVYFKLKKGEILGQFEIGKVIVVEKLESLDFKFLEIIEKHKSLIKAADFENLAIMNRLLIIIQITKLEQLITSPIEIDKRSKKEWIVMSKEV